MQNAAAASRMIGHIGATAKPPKKEGYLAKHFKSLSDEQLALHYNDEEAGGVWNHRHAAKEGLRRAMLKDPDHKGFKILPIEYTEVKHEASAHFDDSTPRTTGVRVVHTPAHEERRIGYYVHDPERNRYVDPYGIIDID